MFTIELILALFCVISTKACIVNDIDFSKLEKFSPWKSASDDKNTSYMIRLCGSLTTGGSSDCHSNTHICMTRKNDPKFTMPLSTANTTDIGIPVNGGHNKSGELWVIAAGDICPDDPSENLTSIINMKCGMTMGSPEFTQYVSCTSYFEWRTISACKDVLQTAVKEVPCYVYDDKNEKFDLSQLIKPYGGYLVDSTEGWQFYINVCRDITDGAATAKCPKGSGACRIHGDTFTDAGQPDTKLKRNVKGNLELHYSSNQTVTGCTVKPATTIEFICPKQGGSKEPLLIYDFNCQYNVQWYTEHACGESVITSDTCRITQEDRNIDIDLSPLTHNPASNNPYEAVALPTNQYWINVCGPIGIQCPDEDHVKNVGGCQTFLGSQQAHVIGKTDQQELRYADGTLTLTYRGGEPCAHSKLQRSTVINFLCNQTADHNGKGHPIFDKEYECTYFFHWETKYACLNHPIDAECRVNWNGRRFDLSPLVRHSGKNWEVLDADKKNKNNRYFINMCNDLLIEGDAARCHPDASVCMIDDHNNAHNLGAYTSNPVYDNTTNQLQITFSNGDGCREKTRKKKSIVTFVCKPGDLESGPVFLSHSLDECIYEFEWYTASACTLSHSTGDNCRVFDQVAGINFDLSKLTKARGQYYNVSTDQYSYLLNVCDNVTNVSSCGHKPNPGVCQISKKKNQNSYNTGQASSKLLYYDGFINLTYPNGDLYRSNISRTTEIAFLCDRDAGIGKPEFVTEDHGYNFKWLTSYACPNPPVECTVTDTIRNKQYDLSGLSKSGAQGNWEVLDDHNPIHKMKYYINVCRPVIEVPIGKGCATFAAACRSKFDTNGQEIIDDTSANRGEVKNGPQIEGDERLYIQYKTSSKLCTEDNGDKSPFLTTIHFICTKGALTKGPNIPIKIGNCEESIIWETEAACPLEMLESDTCTIKDPNSEYTYNLQPLKKTGKVDYYTVQNVKNGVAYRINICDSILTSSCDKTSNLPSSICEVKSESSKTGIANLNNFKLYFTDDGQMTLNYYGERNSKTGRVTEVIVLFLCNQAVEYGVPIFERIEEDKYYFKFPTALACKPQFVDCVTQDSKGNQYDLSALARIHDWMVPDPRPGHSDLSYHINVCRPINTVTGSSCPGGPIGGCQTSTHGESFNMGYIQSKPVVVGDGTIVLRYRNGDLCHRGTPKQAHRSTRITFICSHVQHDPVFEGESEECEYIFHWMTPHACVQAPLNVGKNCKVADPIYNYEFDLSALKRDTDYNVTYGGYSYLLNVCQGLKSTGTGCGPNVANCQTKPADKTFHRDAGHINSSLVYDEGEIILTYNGGQACHDAKYTRKTSITFSCDQTGGLGQPKFVRETSDCIYQFTWATWFACPPYRAASCTAHDPNTGKTFDLSSLAMTDNNYEEIDYTEKKKYIFNVCRSLVHQKGQTCPFYSAACEIDLQSANSTNKFHNLGEVNAEQVMIDNNKVELYYTNGELCEDGKTKTSTRIIFYCSQSVKDSHPSGHFKVGCEHHFVWSSEVGCAVGETFGNNCRVTNKQTGHIFDLSPLSQKTFTLDDNRKHTFNLQVCKPLPTTTCAKTSGACQLEKGNSNKWNAGNANDNLAFDDGVLVLNYTGGTPCHQNKYQRNTLINFICKKGAGEGTPAFIDESERCTYFVYWHTELACEEKVLCSVDLGNNKLKDLSPLIKTSGHHLALSTATKTTNETFYINICEPLNPIYGTLCPPGSSACYIKQGSKPVSLGKLKNRPYKDKSTGKIVLEYSHGSQCPHDTHKNASTRIVFSCNPGPNQGQPIFESISANCVYNFLWDTNVVCEDSDLNIPLKDCTYQDPASGLNINLTSLKTSDPIKINYTGNGHMASYLVNVCSSVKTSIPGCGTTSICKVDGKSGFGYGSISNGEFVKTGDILQMAYKNGQTCQGTTKSEGIIQFICDKNAPMEPKITLSAQCQTILTWNTLLMCPQQASSCSLSYGGHLYDLNILTSITKSWSLKDGAGNQYWLNICEGVHSELQSDKCTPRAAACRKTPSGIIDTLGLISTQTLTMDGDGKTLILEYKEGNSACSHTKRRSDNTAAKVIIKFECGNTVGGPVYVSGGVNNCVFVFKWKSSVACRIERQEVVEKNNTINDPRSGGIIDMNKITSTSTITYGKNTYYIDTRGRNMGTGCAQAVVCLHTKKFNDPGKIIGHFNKRKFYIEDDILQAEYSSDVKCEYDKTKTAKSIIQFKCNKNNITSNPIFLSESRDCVYMFIWETQFTCLTPDVEIPTVAGGTNKAGAVNTQGGGGGTSGGKIGIIVSVFLVAIVVCVLLIVFHKAERRTAFKIRVRRIFGREGRERALYSALPSSIDDMEGNDNDEVILLANEEAMGQTLVSADEQTTSNDVKILNPFEDVGGYHDDSDEDLLA